jgi:hypothetical protein
MDTKILKVNMRRYAKWHEPVQVQAQARHSVESIKSEATTVVKDIDAEA